MTVYADSSAILRWLFAQSRGDEIEGLLKEAEKVVCSRLTLVETRRVIMRALQQGLVDETTATAIREAFARASARWSILEIARAVLTRAEERFPVEPVRTLEAIHLASALLLQQTLPTLQMLSTDDRVRSNALGLGFAVLPEGPAARSA